MTTKHLHGNTTAEHVAECRRIAEKAKEIVTAKTGVGALVLEHGTAVRLGPDKDIPATVIDVSLRGGAVQYRVAWWDGRDRKTEWLEACEIHSDDAPVVRIGFVGK